MLPEGYDRYFVKGFTTGRGFNKRWAVWCFFIRVSVFLRLTSPSSVSASLCLRCMASVIFADSSMVRNKKRLAVSPSSSAAVVVIMTATGPLTVYSSVFILPVAGSLPVAATVIFFDD